MNRQSKCKDQKLEIKIKEVIDAVHRFRNFALCLLIFDFFSITAQAQIEDPDSYPGVWYRIAFDDDGNRIAGDGDGLGWYYYPAVDRYRMWFNNGVYDPDRKGYLKFEAYIMPVDPSKSSYVKIRYNWTTPEWSALDTGSPPLPSDVPTMSEEVTYMSDHHFYLVDNLSNFESIEPVRGYTIQGYNPEWISIDIIGRNARIYRGAWHECQAKDPGDPGNGDPGFLVCCRWSTGDCYATFGGQCVDSYVALGEGRTCADCIKLSGSLDFGDAPSPDYSTLLADDGARHTIVSGIFLGKSVDAEIDGQPDPTASGDDDNGDDEDGVTFTSLLEPGGVASVQVIASTLGYLNAWIDFDGDGSFDGPDEQIFSDTLLSTGAKTLTFTVPEDALMGTTFARFRFNSRGLLSYGGPASDGEVEDYAVQITRHFEPYPTSGVTALKWNQPPAAIATVTPYLFDGVTALSSLGLHQIAADDFQLEAGQPVTGIHWWGAFYNWTESYLPPVQPLGFHIGIWTDVPDAQPDDPETFSHPGTLIWENYCTAWTWALAGYQEAPKDAALGETCFQFSCPLSQDQWFHPPTESGPKGAEPPFYWISVAAIYDTKGPGTNHTWGWLTRTHQFSETGVWIQEVTPGPWPPVEGDQWLQGFPVQDDSGFPWDMTFQLTTYGALDSEQKPEPDDGDVKAALDLHDLALAAAHWLDETP